MNNQDLRKNIAIAYVFTFISNMNLTHGIWMIYLFSRGVSLVELGILEGIFHVTSIFMEIPTGAVADIWGRKASRITGRVLFLISLLFFYYGMGFVSLLPGFILMAISYNLESGAGEALLFDSLKLLGKDSSFMTVNSRSEFLLQMALILSFLGGGYLALHSYPLIFLITGMFSLLGLFSACFFVEPPVLKSSHEGENLSKTYLGTRLLHSIFVQVREGFSTLRKTPILLLLIVSGELIFTFTTTLFFMLQVHWKAEGYTEWEIGIVYAIQGALSGIGGLITPKLEQVLGYRWVLILPILLSILCLWGIAITPWSTVALVSTGLLEGIMVIALSDYTNRLIPSSNRATVLSFQSMAFSLFMIVVFPLTGLLGDYFSTKIAFISIAISASLWYLFFLPYMYKKMRIPGYSGKNINP